MARRLFWGNIPLIALALLFVVMCILASCKANPLKEAQTPQQKAFALYGTFVVYEETGAKLISDADIPADVKSAIRTADAKAKPVADSLLGAAEEYISISSTMKAAPDAATKLSVATANLQQWVSEAEPKINALVSAVRGSQ